MKTYGHFFNKKNKIYISDSVFVINKKRIKKISFHKGERRWVGKYNNQYLLVFFKKLKSKKNINISLNWFDNLEKAYKKNTILLKFGKIMLKNKHYIDTKKDIILIVDYFYSKVNKDELLSAIFNDFSKVNWEKHLPKMYNFWNT